MPRISKTLGSELIDAVDEVLSGKGKLRIVRAPVNITALRKKLRLTQVQFAKRYHLELESVRNWEQGKRSADAATRAYLTCIEKMPKRIAHALVSL